MSPEEMIQQLIAMAEKGEFDNDQIRDLGQQLTSARRRYFTAQRSPESKKAAYEKTKITKLLKKIHDIIKKEALKKVGIEPDTNPPAQFALFIGMHRDDELQDRFNDEYNKLFISKAKESGVTNPETINGYLRGKNKMNEINTNRWAKLAGINEYSSTDFDTYKVGDQIELDPKYFQAFELPDGYVGTVKSIDQADYADETPVYTVKLKNIDPFGDEHEYINVEYKQVK